MPLFGPVPFSRLSWIGDGLHSMRRYGIVCIGSSRIWCPQPPPPCPHFGSDLYYRIPATSLTTSAFTWSPFPHLMRTSYLEAPTWRKNIRVTPNGRTDDEEWARGMTRRFYFDCQSKQRSKKVPRRSTMPKLNQSPISCRRKGMATWQPDTGRCIPFREFLTNISGKTTVELTQPGQNTTSILFSRHITSIHYVVLNNIY